MERYLAGRETLQGVVLILDIRRIPADGDLQMLSWLRSYGRRPIIVLTKTDKLTKNERAKQIALIAKTLEMPRDQLLLFSALNREGRDQIWQTIVAAAGLEQPGGDPT